jgi:hypothetical protein
MTTDLPDRMSYELLRGTIEMLKAAYPGNLTEDEYMAILILLHERQSIRAVADTIEYFTGRNWGRIYNDILGALSLRKPSESILSSVKQQLERHGYRDWLDALDKPPFHFDGPDGGS